MLPCLQCLLFPDQFIFRTRRQTEGDIYKDSADSIDYRYVSAEHIPVINRMCHQAFWPTIDRKKSSVLIF